MSLELITPPAAAPISLVEIRAQTRVTETGEDALLAGYVRSATDHIEATTGLRMITQTWSWTVDWLPPHWQPYRWDSYARLPLAPVQSIVSIAYIDATTHLAQVVDPALYVLKGDRISLAPNAVWPPMWRGTDAVTITFVCGYGDDWNTVPESLRQAVQMLAAYWFAQREAAAIGPEQGPVSHVPFSVREILDGYRVRAV
jgi:uncharacterized phiE125 gp8 family phage protein